MFERFTEKAIKVIMLSNEESRRLGHNFVCTEQMLVGLISEETGIAAQVLKSMGANLQSVRIEVEKIIGHGAGFIATEIPFSPRAKHIFVLSEEESHQLGHNYIGTEHLLLGLIRVEGIAMNILENLGVDSTKIRAQVVRLLNESGENFPPTNDAEDLKVAKLLQAIETKTIGIEQDVAALKKDIRVLRDLMENRKFEP